VIIAFRRPPALLPACSAHHANRTVPRAAGIANAAPPAVQSEAAHD
jgi:hypothetical protein